MGRQQSGENPVFRLCISGTNVMVRFSTEESVDVKCRVRDILTGAYGERLQRTSLLCGGCETADSAIPYKAVRR